MKLIYVLPIVLLVLLAVVIWWFISSSNKSKAEAARAEAQAIREEAAARIRPTMAGQQAFAEQAEQRHAEQAAEAERVEAERLAAEERAAQAAREAAEAQRRADEAAREVAEAEARAEEASTAVDDAGHEVRDAHQRVEETRAAYAADLHRADVVDPDTEVTEEDPVPVLTAEDERAHALAMGEGFQDEVSEAAVVAAGGPTVMAPAIVEPTIVQPPAVDPAVTHASSVGSAAHSDGTMPDDEAVTAEAPLPVDEGAVEADVAEVEQGSVSEAATIPEEPTGEDTWTDADSDSDADAGAGADADTGADADDDEADGVGTSATDGEHASGAAAYERADDSRADAEELARDEQQDAVSHDGDGGSRDESADVMPSDAPETEAWGRRISAIEEVVDGGYGMGSAAPIGDGAQPLGHSVQAYRDTMTFRTEDMPGYDSCEPDVWFYDAGAAERAGFSPAQGG